MCDVTGHVVNVGVLDHSIGIAQSSSDWLINEQYIVLLDPCVVVTDYLVRLGNVRNNPEWTKLHKVAKLTGGAGTSIKPDEGGIVLDLGECCSLLTVEDESQC